MSKLLLSLPILTVLALTCQLTSSQIPSWTTQAEILNKLKAEIPNSEESIETFQDLKLRNEEKSTLERLKQLEKLRNYFTQIFNRILELNSFEQISVFDGVSATCASHSLYTLVRLASLDTFSLHLVDSWGKFPTTGMLRGHVQVLGDFNECVQARGWFPGNFTDIDERPKEMRGKYCSTYIFPGPSFFALNGSSDLEVDVELQEAASAGDYFASLLDFSFPFVMPMMGICFPSSCSDEDIEFILYNANLHIFKNFTTSVILSCTEEAKPPLDAGKYIMIVILAIIVALCAIGTALDLWINPTKIKAGGLAMKVLVSFSLYTNSKKWMSTNQGSENLGCVHGLRTLSMAWVVLGHTYMFAIQFLLRNGRDIKTIYKDWTIYPILNSTFSVDSFFAMSGMLVAYNLLKELDKRKGRFNYLLFIVHRYLRLTPTYMIPVGIVATLLPYFGNGPMWWVAEMESKSCAQHWWHNLLYVNNLIDYTGTEMCYWQSWYLAIDMQFFILSPIVLYPLWRWKMVGIAVLAFLNVASIIIPAVVTYVKDLPAGSIETIDTKEYQTAIYYHPWCRFGPYVAGILVGYLLNERRKDPKGFQKLPWWFMGAGWALCTAGALGVIYGPYEYYDPTNVDYTFNSWHALLYAGIHRWAWGVVISWIIFACVSGYGGPINGFLSLKLFMPLGRLTFCMYIVSTQIQMIYHLGMKHPVEFSHFNLVYIFFAHLLVSGLVAYVFTLTLESPFIQLEKILFAPFNGPANQTKPLIQPEGSNGEGRQPK